LTRSAIRSAICWGIFAMVLGSLPASATWSASAPPPSAIFGTVSDPSLRGVVLAEESPSGDVPLGAPSEAAGPVLVSVVPSAWANPAPPATATPMPSANANPPTRPTCRPAPPVA
jgi:hypothetical protein